MTTTMNENIIFSNNTINSIKYIIKKYKLTMNTLIQGIWSIILSMFNIDNNFDILFGATVSGRSVASIDIIGLEYMIGLFINAIPVRIIVDKDNSLINWLEKIQLNQIEARQYEFIPLVKIQNWSEIIKKGIPLFETILIFENYPIARIEKTETMSPTKVEIKEGDDKIEGEKVELIFSNAKMAEKTNYPISLISTPNLFIQISYYKDIIDELLIKKMAEQIKLIIKKIRYYEIKEERKEKTVKILLNKQKKNNINL